LYTAAWPKQVPPIHAPGEISVIPALAYQMFLQNKTSPKGLVLSVNASFN
jgi:hypothetical protein